MLRFLISFLILVNVNAVFASVYNYAKRQPIRVNSYNTENYYNHLPFSVNDLSALEKYTLNKTYTRQNPIIRLERLEALAFGSVQSGDLASRYQNVEAALLSRPNYNNKKTALGNILNYFAGQATGITPPVTTNTNFNHYYPVDDMGFHYPSQNYGTQRLNQYSNGIFGHGYGYMNSGLGNGGSVRILP